jgi:hypothetical protein
MVESPEVAQEIVVLAIEIDPSLLELDRKGRIALEFASALQPSFRSDLSIEQVPENAESHRHQTQGS